MRLGRWLILVLLGAACASRGEISPGQFRHHFIASEMPGRNVGLGASALADFDLDGDLDFAAYNRGDGVLYWFERPSEESWIRHRLGEARISQLGCAGLDVDRDGWTDIVIGGYWFRNPGDPRTREFDRHVYDSTIQREIHDVVVADINGDGRDDIVAMGDGDGLFWYSIPENPTAEANWPRTVITLAVRNDLDDIHGGISSKGVGDLDGDGDRDVMVTNRWFENVESGKRWIEHRLLFGRIGPWGHSSRSWIADVDRDGDNDVVAADCDGQNSGLAWIENLDGKMLRHRVHWLANRAPGTRGSFHSLRMADFDNDGDEDILVAEQEDPLILPQGAAPRWYVFENLSTKAEVRFLERVILDARLGGHDLHVGDVDGDGDIDIVSKIWSVWKENGNGGKVHLDWLENRLK